RLRSNEGPAADRPVRPPRPGCVGRPGRRPRARLGRHQRVWCQSVVSVGRPMLAAMAEAYTVLWTHDTCRALRSAGREGLRPPVAFSGIHLSLPSWRTTDVGDHVYALHVNRCVLHVVSRMIIVDKDRRDCCGPIPVAYGSAFPGHADWAMLGADS